VEAALAAQPVGFALKARLLYRPNTVVTSIPVLIGQDPEQ
jgi:hypothetical protein